MQWGRVIEWDGKMVEVSGCDSSDECTEAVVRSAARIGWRPPMWWQFWRWREGWWHWSAEDRDLARQVLREMRDSEGAID
jgi:hypothetical protein